MRIWRRCSLQCGYSPPTSDGNMLSLSETAADGQEEVRLDLPGGPLWLRRPVDWATHLDRDVLLRDDAAPEPPYWVHVWPAAVSLARLVMSAASELAGARVIELGCGLGVPGLVAGRCGAAVVLTDRDVAAVHFARRSAARNGLRAAVVCMDWRETAVRGRYDLCLAADVTYDPTSHNGLTTFLAEHLAAEGELWAAESVRAEETPLPDLLRRHFRKVRECRMAESEDGHRVWVRVLRAGGWR
jgi:predicted nicotinamide N-methyase